MCWCAPDVRTPCCGTERCHDAARRRWLEDKLRGEREANRRWLAPGATCRWCEPRRTREAAAKAVTCPTCGGCGTVAPGSHGPEAA